MGVGRVWFLVKSLPPCSTLLMAGFPTGGKTGALGVGEMGPTFWDLAGNSGAASVSMTTVSCLFSPRGADKLKRPKILENGGQIFI